MKLGNIKASLNLLDYINTTTVEDIRGNTLDIRNTKCVDDIDDHVVEYMASVNLDIREYIDDVVIVESTIESKKLHGLVKHIESNLTGETIKVIIINSNIKSKLEFNRALVHELTHIVQEERDMFDFNSENKKEYKQRAHEIHAFAMDRNYGSELVLAKYFCIVKSVFEFINYIKL